MTVSKPLVFDDVAPPKTVPVKVGGGKPLSFGPSTPTATPVAPKPAKVKALSMDNVVVPRQRASAPPAAQTIHVKLAISARDQDVLNLVNTSLDPSLGVKEMHLVQQIQQIMPLKTEVVLNWGDKTLQRMRDGVQSANLMMDEFTRLKGNETVQTTLDGIQRKPAASMWGRLTQSFVDPTAMRPQLNLLLASLPNMITRCEEQIVTCKQNQVDITVKLAIIAAAATYAGTIADTILDQAVHNRRIVLQQGAMQAALIVEQLDTTMKAILALQQAATQLLNFTLPNFEQSRTRS